MIARAVLRYIRITPRKFRQIIPLVKGRNPEEAIAILYSVKKGASKYAIDLLKSAIANAKRKQGVEVSNLYISNLIASGGPMLKRFRAASMGRASMIKKRTSHITVELDDISTRSDTIQKEASEIKEVKAPKGHKAPAAAAKGHVKQKKPKAKE